MKIATWNINGVKARLETSLAWLKAAQPDVVALQEIKSEDASFPVERFEELGYNVATHGQKGFNGVGFLSKIPLEGVERGLSGDDGDEQARWIEATVSGDRGAVTLCCLYLPNGNPLPGPKFDYKLAWMRRLRARAAELMALEQNVLMLGDYNIIPQREDCYQDEDWEDDAAYHPASRSEYRQLLAQGWTDTIRAFEPSSQQYTFWDYQAGAWRKNLGFRIDHILASPQAADRLMAAGIDKDVRGWDTPSDHVPVWCELAV